MRAGHAALGFIGFALAASVACAPTAAIDCTDPEVGAQCSAYQDGGTTDGPNVDAPAGCDLTKGPKDSAACIDDSVGVFVSPNGDDGATGNKATPVKSIGAALTLAASRGLPRVYVCEGNYDSATTITAPIAIYGGLSCAWAYTGNLPKLAPAKGVPLTVTGVSAAVTIQDLEFDGAADMDTPGDSAIAAFVSQSMGVTFTNVTLSAGAGITGAAGATRSNYTGDSAAAGGMFMATSGGTGGVAACVDGTKSGGGAGGDKTGAGLADGSSTPTVGASNSGATKATSCDPGLGGALGLAGNAASASAQSGSLTNSGWSTASVPPNNAPDGNPAQGGGGGGTKLDSMAPGGAAERADAAERAAERGNLADRASRYCLFNRRPPFKARARSRRPSAVREAPAEPGRMAKAAVQPAWAAPVMAAPAEPGPAEAAEAAARAATLHRSRTSARRLSQAPRRCSPGRRGRAAIRGRRARAPATQAPRASKEPMVRQGRRSRLGSDGVIRTQFRTAPRNACRRCSRDLPAARAGFSVFRVVALRCARTFLAPPQPIVSVRRNASV